MRQNALLVRWRDGYTEVTDPTAIASDRRHEGFLSLQDATGVDVATATADANLEFSALDTVSFEVAYEDTGGAKPYTDFSPGDTLSVTDPTGALVTDRVLAVSLENDEHGYAAPSVEVGAIYESPDVRAQRVFKRMVNGTLGGRSQSATGRGGGGLTLPFRSGGGAQGETSPWEPGSGADSAQLKGSGSVASGDYSVAEGEDTLALGYASHAEGENTTANAFYAHAEGDSSVAQGDGSHAEGFNTNASDEYAHAEGAGTEASAHAAHAEGDGSIASGVSSHAEGTSTIAVGDASHAEGHGTTAKGVASHAQGLDATAYADFMDSLGGTGPFGSSAWSQRDELVTSRHTIFANGATPVDMDWTGNPFPFPVGGDPACIYFRTEVVAVRHSTDDVSAWVIEGVIKCTAAGVYSFVGTPSVTLIAQDAGASTWSVTPQLKSALGGTILSLSCVGSGTSDTVGFVATHRFTAVST